jgi:hypothetical protein
VLHRNLLPLNPRSEAELMYVTSAEPIPRHYHRATVRRSAKAPLRGQGFFPIVAMIVPLHVAARPVLPKLET